MNPCLFVAPSGASGFFKRVARALADDVTPSYHSMLISTAVLPDPAWSLRGESDALGRVMETLDSFHVVAFSGGATVVLRHLASGEHRERIRSLTLMEPPWVGVDLWSDEERKFVEEFDRLVDLPPARRCEAFSELYAPGGGLPRPIDVERIAEELRTCWRGYRAESLDRDVLRGIDVPVYLPVAEKSPARMHRAASLLAGVFPRATVEVLDGVGHFDLFFARADAVAAGIRRCLS